MDIYLFKSSNQFSLMPAVNILENYTSSYKVVKSCELRIIQTGSWDTFQ